MKRLLLALVVVSSSLAMTGCGFGMLGGGCCPDYSAVSYTTTSCCSSNW
ncbi:Uncharacterised protein [Legionella beliardensis]|uniref:Lipoprotein n=1 Tax=Legionella beliardensis TaxID=91822 RepID=A0A378I3I8_9GAMM|nr:hypothetical protein [Legionella beliardensis]STX29285.1 Uncharacterised protein [Legionella beliardensis]